MQVLNTPDSSLRILATCDSRDIVGEISSKILGYSDDCENIYITDLIYLGVLALVRAASKEFSLGSL